MKRQRFTVLWRRDHWEVRGVGFTRHTRKADAVANAVKQARAHYAAGHLAQVQIRGKDGRIREERTYGKDPRRTKG